MKVSVVIPVKDDAERLRLCLRALSRQTLPVDAFEVIVADNGSSDSPERALAGLPFARVVREPKPGASAARNRGIRDSRGDVIAFTDADCLPGPDWLAAGLAALEKAGGSGLVAGRVDVFPRDPANPTGPELFDMIHAFDQRLFVERWHFGATANLFAAREAVEALAGFDESIPYYGEDLDFGQRAWKAGRAVTYAPEAVVRHPARPEWASFHARQRRTVRSNPGGRGLRRLLLDLWHDWPDAAAVSASLRHPHGVKAAAATAWARVVRARFRLELFWEQPGGKP